MNRNLAGERLTRRELIEIAVEHGLAGSAEELADGHEVPTWKIHNMTRKVRHRMWARGELILDTRTAANSAEA
jgi:hypothetical protein